MKSHLNHVLLNIRIENLPFYNDLMAQLGWATIFASDEMAGFGAGGNESIWFAPASTNAATDYDSTGMNHLGFGAESQADVDAFAQYLEDKGIALLFETPRHRPEFAENESQTYYQVMFESPDRILFEFVYTGAKQ